VNRVYQCVTASFVSLSFLSALKFWHYKSFSSEESLNVPLKSVSLQAWKVMKALKHWYNKENWTETTKETWAVWSKFEMTRATEEVVTIFSKTQPCKITSVKLCFLTCIASACSLGKVALGCNRVALNFPEVSFYISIYTCTCWLRIWWAFIKRTYTLKQQK